MIVKDSILVDFNSILQSSLDEFSEETFDKFEQGVNPEIVTETLSFGDLVLTFLLELREFKNSIRCFIRVCSQKDQQSFRGYKYGTED